MKTIIPLLSLFLNAICSAELRTWTAINGKKVEAELISNEKGIVKLKLKSGKAFDVPLNKLSEADQDFITPNSPQQETIKESEATKLMRRLNKEPSEQVLIDSDLWYVVKDGTVKIIHNKSGGLLGTPGNRLPETIDEKPVTSIGTRAYARTSQSVFMIPDTVTNIGEEAFADCYHTLEKVKIGKNVKSIGKGAFRFSMPLKSITIPGNVVNIGEEAFFGCRTLADITLQEGVTSIGEKAFVNTYIKEITIPKSIKSVGKDAFESCTRLTTVTFLGDAPEEVGRVFSTKVIIYRKPEAKGWSDTWSGKPVKLISEKP